jgi:hypothetical protein
MRLVPAFVLLACACGNDTTAAPASALCAPCPECPTTPAESATGSEVVEEPTPAEGPLVVAGTCDTSWLPPGLVTDVDDAATLRLVETVRRWIERDDLPGIDVATGVIYAKSADDTGADPPYPSFVGREGVLACGHNARWLRDHARGLLALHAAPDMGEGVHCTENVCCYAALGEYDSSGTLVFDLREDERVVLRALAIVADNGTLGEDYVRSERQFVTGELGRHARGRCRGEPPGVW